MQLLFAILLVCLIGGCCATSPVLGAVDDVSPEEGSGTDSGSLELDCDEPSKLCTCPADVTAADKVCANDGITYDSRCHLCCAMHGERPNPHLQLVSLGKCE